ncbi:cytochrome P450 [Breoghania sp.]|uniref:cytochrome P450 n=1 Tax=Breoghania sp. TaxID=2065378 RepID=UPI0026180A8A|nr:cytochrome P450 [Breoghania sp.]MDJ0933269.1 cytochrome P450 [Breoghania sp.]
MSDDSLARAGLVETEVDWWTVLTDPDYLESPYADLKRLRELGPVHCDSATGGFFVLGYEAFRSMATLRDMGRDTRLWSNGWNRDEVRQNDPLTYELFREFQPQVTNANSPDHRRMRGVCEKACRAADLTPHLPMIVAECRRLLDGVPVGSTFDFMETVAIPPEMEDQVARWIVDLGFIGNIMMSPEQKQNAQTALREFKDYLRERFAFGIDVSGGGFVGMTLQALADGTMDEEENLSNLVTLIAGGTATATFLGNGLLALLRHPDQFEELRADRALLPSAIEEMLRFEPGCSSIIRVAINDFQCGDTRIPKGALAIDLMGATNRDPDVFDIVRRPNAHHVFDTGAHVCLGKTLVRMTAEALFTELMDRFKRIELAGDPVWWAHRSDQHGLHTLPIKVGTA